MLASATTSSRPGHRSAVSSTASAVPSTAKKTSRRPPMRKKSPYAPSGKSTAKPSSAGTAAAPPRGADRSTAKNPHSILRPSKWRAAADASLAKPLNVPDGLSEKEKGACIMFIINPVWWETHGDAARSIAQRLTWNESDVDFDFNDHPREYYLEDTDRNYPRRVQIDYNHEMHKGFKLAGKEQKKVWKACSTKVDAMKQHGELPAHLIALLDEVWEWGIPDDLAAFVAACDEHLAALEAAAAHLRDNEETAEPEETEANVETKTPSSANFPTSSLAVDRKKAFKRGIDAEAKRLGRREDAQDKQKASRAALVAKKRAMDMLKSIEPATSNSSAAGKQHRAALGDCTNNASRVSTATASASASMGKSPDTRSFPDSKRAKGVVGMGTACGKRKGEQLPSLSAKKRRTEPTSSEKSGRSKRKSVPPGKRSRSDTIAQKSGRSKRMSESSDHDDVPPGKRSRSDVVATPKQNPVAVAQRPAAPVDGANTVAAPAAAAPAAAAPAAAPVENEGAPEREEPVDFGGGGDDAFGDNLDDVDAHDVAEREVQPVKAMRMLLQLEEQRRARKKVRMLKELECTLDGPYWRR